MRVEVINPKTGEKCTSEAPNLRPSDIDALTREYSTDAQLKEHIENLPFSAETKAILFKLAQFTVKVGEAIVRIGKRILEIAIVLAEKFKHATFALIIACLLSLLISMIPLIGPVLASLLAPFIALVGLTVGVWEDLKREDPKFAVTISDAGKIFSPLASTNPE